jgi:chromosome partitioning protein
VLFTINDKNKTNRKINQLIRSRLGGTVYRSEIPRDTMVIEAAGARLPVCAYAPNSPAAAAHLDFAVEFMERHRDTMRKNGVAIEPPPPRDQIITALLRWRTGRDGILTKPTTDSVQKDRARLDKMLYGDRTPLERIHLSMVHFFIEHRFWLLLLVGFAMISGGVLLTFGLSSLRQAAGVLGLP